MCFNGYQEFLGLFDHGGCILIRNSTFYFVIPQDSLIESVQKPSVEFRAYNSSFGKVLSEGCMYTCVLPEVEVAFVEEGHRKIEHGVICSPCRKVGITLLQQDLGGFNCALGFFVSLLVSLFTPQRPPRVRSSRKDSVGGTNRARIGISG